MKYFTIVYLKECTDNLRDKRTLISSLMLAIVAPLLFLGLMRFVIDTAIGESSEPVELSVVGAQHSPILINFLKSKNTLVKEVALRDPFADVQSGAQELVLIIKESFNADFAQGLPHEVHLIHDSSAFGRARRNQRQVEATIRQFSRTIGAQRLQVRGIDTSVINPISVRSTDVASPADRALSILASLPYLIMLVVFMGGFYLAIDTTAGEREHGSLEPLLTQPIGRGQLVMGKIAATCTFAALSLTTFLLCFSFSLPMVPFDAIGMSLEVGFVKSVTIFFICMPLMVFAAALLCVIASFAKSYKEAQTYLTIVIIVPTLPIMMTQFLNIEASYTSMLVPSLSQALLVTEVITNEVVNTAQVAISWLTTSLYAAALSWLAIYLYRREKILG